MTGQSPEVSTRNQDIINGFTRLVQIEIWKAPYGQVRHGILGNWNTEIHAPDNPFRDRSDYLRTLLTISAGSARVLPPDEFELNKHLGRARIYLGDGGRRPYNPDITNVLQFIDTLVRGKIGEKDGARKKIRGEKMLGFINKEVLKREMGIIDGLYGETIGRADLRDLVKAFLSTNPAS